MVWSGKYNRRLGKRQGVHRCSRPWCICLYHSVSDLGCHIALPTAWPPTARSLVRSHESSSGTILLPRPAVSAVQWRGGVINMSLGHVSIEVA